MDKFTYSLEIYILHQYPVVIATKIMPRLGWMNVYIGYVGGAILSVGIVVFIIYSLKKLNIYIAFFMPIILLSRLFRGIQYNE